MILYQVIYDSLVASIRKGDYTRGDKLPSENDLCKQFNVSRITAKRALNELEISHYIKRIKGKGNFVTYTSKIELLNQKQVLFVMPSAAYFNDAMVTQTLVGVKDILKEKDIELIMVSSDFLEKQTAENLMYTYSGLIYYVENTDKYMDLFFSMDSKNFPIVFLDKKLANLTIPTITSDNHTAGVIATDYLLNLGHHRIAFIFEHDMAPETAKNRYLGYLEALNKNNLPFHSRYLELSIEKSPFSEIFSYIKKNQITAIFCENDYAAIQLIKQLQENQISVPEKISIMGVDNTYASSLVNPPLSTVEQNFYKIGTTAGNVLFEKMINPEKKVPSQCLQVKLIIRNSAQEKVIN